MIVLPCGCAVRCGHVEVMCSDASQLLSLVVLAVCDLQSSAAERAAVGERFREHFPDRCLSAPEAAKRSALVAASQVGAINGFSGRTG